MVLTMMAGVGQRAVAPGLSLMLLSARAGCSALRRGGVVMMGEGKGTALRARGLASLCARQPQQHLQLQQLAPHQLLWQPQALLHTCAPVLARAVPSPRRRARAGGVAGEGQGKETQKKTQETAMPPTEFTVESQGPSVTSYDIRKHSESGLFKSMTIKAESWNYAVLDSFFGFIQRTADELGIKRGGMVHLPTHKKVYTVLSSPHVYKKHRSQYVLKTHKRCIKIKDVTEQTAATFIDYIMDHAPPGISSRVIMRAAAAVPSTTSNAQQKS